MTYGFTADTLDSSASDLGAVESPETEGDDQSTDVRPIEAPPVKKARPRSSSRVQETVSGHFGRTPLRRQAPLSRLLGSDSRRAEREAFMQEHRDLSVKEVTEGLSEQEAKRLLYVRWSLDRYEEAEYGPTLDRMDALSAFGTQIAAKLRSFQDELAALVDHDSAFGRTKSRGGGRRRRR